MSSLLYAVEIQTIDEDGNWVMCTLDPMPGESGIRPIEGGTLEQPSEDGLKRKGKINAETCSRLALWMSC